MEIPSNIVLTPDKSPSRQSPSRQPLKPAPVLEKLLVESSINKDEVTIEQLNGRPKRQSNSKNSTSFAAGKAIGHNVDSRQNLKKHSNKKSSKVNTAQFADEFGCFCFPE